MAMGMKPSLSLRMSQQLTLTPQLQQSIRLLQLSTLEMDQEIDQALEDNPFLEREDEPTAESEAFGVAQADQAVSEGDRIVEADQSADLPLPSSAPSNDGPSESSTDSVSEDNGNTDDTSWEGDGTTEVATQDSEWGDDAPASRKNNDDDTASAIDLASSHISLSDHLSEQALGLRVSPLVREALAFLIGNLNEDGYLEDSLQALAASLAPKDLDAQQQACDALEEALDWLQDMEPLGVGARDLQECLRLQVLGMRNGEAAQAALKLVDQDMALLAKRDIKRLCSLTGLNDPQVREGLTLIHGLEPKPGRRFAQTEQLIVRPDVIVTREGDEFKVSLNPAVMPRLKVMDQYTTTLKTNQAVPAQQRLQEARWFVKNIAQRFETIVRVSTAIVMRQRGFFLHGEMAMRPMVLREIADELGLHESTVSRVTTAKYMATPWGTFELKYFFGSGLGTEVGGSASSTAVRALIKQLIGAESAQKPLSDNQISKMLKEQGIDCARRTVAKYREAMRIAPANLRKAL